MINLKKEVYPWLDWLRFIAAMIVVIAHSRDLMFVKYADLESKNIFITLFYAIGKLGNEAVLIFFVLSGFLVGGIGVKRIHNEEFKWSDYIIDRVTRIMVPLVPAMILTVGMGLYLAGEINWGYVLGNLFSLQGIFVPQLKENEALWTLSYEMWFYISILAIGLFFSDRNEYFKSAFGSILVIVCVLVFSKLEAHYLLCWLVGAAAFLFRPKFSYKLIAVGTLLLLYGMIGRQVGRGSESIDLSFFSFVPSEQLSRVIFSFGFSLLVQQIILIKSLPKVEKRNYPLDVCRIVSHITSISIKYTGRYDGCEKFIMGAGVRAYD